MNIARILNALREHKNIMFSVFAEDTREGLLYNFDFTLADTGDYIYHGFLKEAEVKEKYNGDWEKAIDAKLSVPLAIILNLPT